MLMSAIIWIFILSSSLIAAVCLYDLYRRKKQQLDDVEGDLALVCHFSKFPHQSKRNEELCVDLMQKYKMSPNTETSRLPRSQSTPFLLACFGGSLTLIQFMLENGADITCCNLNGDGALYMAIYGIDCRLRAAERKVQRSKEIQRAVLIIDCLINSGCDINCKNVFGFTPLHWAATTGEKWLVDHLLKRGADASIKTVLSGALPSSFASEMKQLQIHLLLKEAEHIGKSF